MYARFCGGGRDGPDFAAMQRTLEAMGEPVPSWANPTPGLVVQLGAGLQSATPIPAADAFGASEWWLGCNPHMVSQDEREYEQLMSTIRISDPYRLQWEYDDRCLRLILLFLSRCVCVQRRPERDECERWPIDWFYDSRYCINGKPLLPVCPLLDQLLTYRSLERHWRAMREMAADVEARAGWPSACTHDGALRTEYECAACFDAELRTIVAMHLRTQSLVEVDGELDEYRRRRAVEEAALHKWREECARRAQVQAEVRQWCEAEQRREEEERARERSLQVAARMELERQERERADAALVERVLAGRPRLTESNAADYPPPYLNARRCLGAECACKRYVYHRNPKMDLEFPRRFKTKDPLKCHGSRADRWVCPSPCDGDLVHFSLSELHESDGGGRAWPGRQFARAGTLVRSRLVSETSELMVWYAQVTGKPWLRGPFPCTPTCIDEEVTFERAFSQWRRLVMRGQHE